MKMDIYAELGIKKDTPKEEVKRKYKDFCKKNHPDMGGDTKEFQEKQQHYAIILDDTKRKRYDETGETETVDRQQKLNSLIVSLFDALALENPDNIDDKIQQFKSNVLNQINQNISKHNKDKEKLQTFIKRIKLKSEGVNPVLIHLDRKIEVLEMIVNKLINDKKDQAEVFEYVEKHFSFENIESENINFGSGVKFTFGGVTFGGTDG